jgi:hypothetical protein
MIMATWWERHFKNQAEKDRQARADEKKKIEGMDGEELREYLRNIPSQFYSIVKQDFDGKGNPKAIAEEVDKADEPTKEKIVARYIERYGGGDYIVYAYKPVGRVRFASFHVDGDPVLPNQEDKIKGNPIDKAIASAIGQIPASELAKIGPEVLRSKLGLATPPPPQVQGFQMDPVLNEKIAIARELRGQGRFQEAAQALTGNIPQTRNELDSALAILDKLDKRYGDKDKDRFQSEKAQEYAAIGNAVTQVVGGFKEIVVTAVDRFTGQTYDGDNGGQGNRFICGKCGKDLPSRDVESCPHCGAWINPPDEPEEYEQPAPPPPMPVPTAPPPTVETPINDDGNPNPTPTNMAGTGTDSGAGNRTATEESSPAPLPPTVPAPKPEPPVATVIEIPKMSEYELKFLYEAMPKVFFNRIRRKNGKSFPKWFKLLFPLAKSAEPKNAAMYDLDYMAKKFPEQKLKILEYAKIGYDGMVSKYKPMVEDMIKRFDFYATELKKSSPKAFKEKYPTTNDKDIKDLQNYNILKPVWDYMQTEEAKAWWTQYCKWIVKLVENPQSQTIGDVTPEVVGGKENAPAPEPPSASEPAPEPATDTPPAPSADAAAVGEDSEPPAG